MSQLNDLLTRFRALFSREPDTSHIPDLNITAQQLVDRRISHALVLPDQNFLNWYAAVEPYIQHFERVVVVRSPAGNDLNRFRNVTAVETAGVWVNNEALAHIRRAYPNVVRVDVIPARTPEQLKLTLKNRVTSNDRYGEKSNADRHIDDRLVLEWPAHVVGSRITLPFDADNAGRKHEGVEIYAPPGTPILSTVAGTVATVVQQPTALGYGQYVQVSVTHSGVTYLVTHARLRDIRVKRGDTVKVGDVLGLSDWESVKLVIQQPGSGYAGYPLPNIINPTAMIYWDHLRLRPTANLRIRKQPGTQYETLATVKPEDLLETMEPHGRALAKVTRDGQWINVRSPMGVTGYASALYLNATTPSLLSTLRPTGVNLDITHPLGRPSAQRLGQMGWVRLLYNVSYNPDNNSYGNTDLAAAQRRYRPYLEQYTKAGYKVMLIFTHQTYGEGQGYVWPQMDSGRWRQLTGQLAAMVRTIAGQYAGSNLVSAYQIWNEQDAHQGAGASVSMPPGNYAYLFAECYKAIREVDKHAQIITGGHTGGPGNGSAYARTTVNALPPGILPDGVAFHPYGRGTVPGPPYSIFGHIDEEVQAYQQVLPGRPLWMTEFGVLDRPNDPAGDIANYATSLVNHLNQRYPGQIAAMIWYAWAQGMHNGYGLVGRDDKPRQPLYDRFLAL